MSNRTTHHTGIRHFQHQRSKLREEKALTLYAEGHVIADIARQVGVTRQTAWRYLNIPKQRPSARKVKIDKTRWDAIPKPSLFARLAQLLNGKSGGGNRGSGF